MKSDAFFQLSLYLAVLIPCVWALLMSTGKLDFREMSISVGAMLGSTGDTVYEST